VLLLLLGAAAVAQRAAECREGASLACSADGHETDEEGLLQLSRSGQGSLLHAHAALRDDDEGDKDDDDHDSQGDKDDGDRDQKGDKRQRDHDQTLADAVNSTVGSATDAAIDSVVSTLNDTLTSAVNGALGWFKQSPPPSAGNDSNASEAVKGILANASNEVKEVLANATAGTNATLGANASAIAHDRKGAEIAPFGREVDMEELQKRADQTQDTLVEAVEQAEVAEIKRSVYRALTRLRAAEIKEFDTIARLEVQAIDDYNTQHHYVAENPLEHIDSGEQDFSQDKFASFHG
jgi:hypothetical protein